MPSIQLIIENTSLDEDTFDQLCADVYQELVDNTPVDTGFCRDQWTYTVRGDVATFFNPTEYASYLEDGWSSQAPAGMIGPVLQSLPDMVNGYT